MAEYRPRFYDPLGTANITTAVCRELEQQPLIFLESEISRFRDSGLYAIYYRGSSLPLYAPLKDYDIPVYAGQAASHNSRTGRVARSAYPLWKRVGDHRKSIHDADLPLTEFAVRLLGLPDVHADLGENGLRVFYQPVWNAVLNGFGNHEQGSKTRKGQRTKWDTVHPGRNRTHGADSRDVSQLKELATKHIASQLERYGEAPWHQS